MQKIQIYDTHPFLILMKSGVVFHLRREQYEKVADAWVNGDRVKLEPYDDPESGKKRVVMLDSFNIEIVDEAPYAQKEHWVKQGGYVCKFDTFHERRDYCDCKPRPDYSKQKNSQLSLDGPTFADTDAEYAEENLAKMRSSFEKRKEEINNTYADIEKALESKGQEWCERNKEKWREQSKTSGAMINWYGLFFTNHAQRAQAAIASFQAAQKKSQEAEEVEDGDIPF